MQLALYGCGEMARQQVRLADGLSNADRNDVLYGYFSAAADVGGHFPPVRSLARVCFRRRNVQVFVANAGNPRISAGLTDPNFNAGFRPARFRFGPRRRVRRVGRHSGVDGMP